MNNSRIVALFFITIICCSGTLFILKDKPVQISTTNKEKPFVIVIPSYNNAQWYDRNLGSVFSQQYSNYRVIYIDDCSTDDTYDLVKKYIEKHNQTKRITLLRNKSNHGAMANHWRANHLCQDHEIIIDLDGDDWLKDEFVLQRVNNVYADPHVWMTYGQFEIYPGEKKGWCKEIPSVIHEKNLYREYEWVTSHLRTYYAWLFKKIWLQDCIYKGAWLPVDCDKLLMFSMLEMAREHSRFIPDILHVYNCATPFNDYKAHLVMHRFYNQLICSGKKYNKIIQAPDFHKKSPRTEMVIFSKDNPLLLQSLLESSNKYIKEIQHTTIFYHATEQQYIEAYDSLKQNFNSVTFISYKTNKFPTILNALLSRTDYVLFSDDNIIVKKPINLKNAIQALQKTHAYGFYLTLGKNITENNQLNRKAKMPQLIDVENNIYAWQFSNEEYEWRKPQTFDLALYNAATIKRSIAQTKYDSPEKLIKLWETASFDMEHIGLTFEQSPAYVVDHCQEKSTFLTQFLMGSKLNLASLNTIKNKSTHVNVELSLC